MQDRLKGWTIVFDLDGTLVETAPDLLGALNHTLGRAGLAPVELSVIHIMIGDGAKAMIAMGFGFHGQSVDDIAMEDHWNVFIAHYRDNVVVDSFLYDGVVEAMEALDAEGATLAVCTNKQQVLAERVLTEIGIADRFAAIVGADSVPNRKPDPGHIVEAVIRSGGDPSRAVMIGDSRTDEKAARNAGLPFLFVPFGYEAAPADEIDAVAIVHHYSELLRSVMAATA
mgnify:CR=1 FL=1